MISLLLGFQLVLAGESQQPYIDFLKNKMNQENPQNTAPQADSVPDPYIQSLKKRDTVQSNGGESYIDFLRRTDPKRYEARPTEAKGYTDQEKSKLESPKTGGAIQAVKEGRSELTARREGEIHHGAGFRMGAQIKRDIVAPSALQANPFKDIYGSGWVLDLALFYEYQPFHSEWWGNLGIGASFGASNFSGFGRFQRQIKKPSGALFELNSQTKMSFYIFPVNVSVIYRFNTLRLIRPYVQIGGGVTGFLETRTDERGSKYGYSKGMTLGGGMAILLDWISSDSINSLYEAFGVKHYYLTLDYAKAISFGNNVNFSISGFSAGLAFEY